MGVSALEDRLAGNPHLWNHLLKTLAPHTIQVELPILSQQNHMNLKEDIREMPETNFSNLFDPEEADFNAVADIAPLALVDVIQHIRLNITSIPLSSSCKWNSC